MTLSQLAQQGIEVPLVRQLDEIFEMKPPMQDYARWKWLEAPNYDMNEEDRVLIKTNSGKQWPKKINVRGQEINIMPKGVRVPRHIAYQLLEDYGKHGKYRDKDQATGMTMQYFRTRLTPAEQDMYKQQGFKIIDDYLTHVVDEPAKPEDA